MGNWASINFNACLSLGSCCWGSCKEDRSSQNEEANERTQLLQDPVGNNTAIPRTHSDDFASRYSSSTPKKTDEQSALNRILQETATNVIDVGALDSHNLEQHEYVERMSHYAQRLAGGQTQNWRPNPPTPLLQDVPAPERLLAATPLLNSDLMLISSCVQKLNAALSNIRIEHKEDLVVPFRIPEEN